MNANDLLDIFGDAKPQYVKAAEASRPRQRKSPRKLLILGLAAALLLTTLTAAGTLQRWLRPNRERFHVDKQAETLAQELDLSNVPADPSQPNGLPQATVDGVTITAAQTIVDANRAQISFKVKGFSFPKDGDASYDTSTCPGFGSIQVYLDGVEHGWGGGFQWIMEKDTYLMEDGQLQFDLHMTKNSDEDSFVGKEITVRFTDMGASVNTLYEKTMEGTWELKWTLEGADKYRSVELDAPVDAMTSSRLKQAELYPSSIHLVLYTEKLCGDCEEFYPKFIGYEMKDGTVLDDPIVIKGGGGSYGYTDEANHIWEETWANDCVMDVDAVKSLIFTVNEQGDTMYIPLA